MNTPLSKFLRAIRAVLILIGIAWLTYAWLFQGVEWAGNILKFLTGLTFVLSVLLCIPDVKKALCEQGRSVPEWVSQLFGIVLCLTLASQGHYVMASVFIFNLVMKSAAFSKSS